MSNDVCLDKVNEIQVNANRSDTHPVPDTAAEEGQIHADSGNDKGSGRLIVYRRPGGGSGIGVCKKTSELSMQSRFENVCSVVGKSVNLKGTSQKCTLLNNFNIMDVDIGNREREAMQPFNEHEYIFGSTSPRGMINSDYIGIGGVGIGTSIGVIDSGTGKRSLQKDSNESDNNISSCSTLDIVNKVEQISLKDLEVQIRDLSQRLQKSEKDRDDFKRKFTEAFEEKNRCYRRMEVLSTAHESRITEMHCVIAELSKKLRSKQDNIIIEETEIEESEISFQEGSVYNSEIVLTNQDPLEIDYSLDEPNIINETDAKSQVEALQEEVLHLKAEIAFLQSQIASNNALSSPNAQLLETQDSIEDLDYEEVDEISDCYSFRDKSKTIMYDNDYYKTDDDEDNKHKNAFYLNSFNKSKLCQNSDINQTENKHINNEEYRQGINNSTETSVPKMAERIKLRRVLEDEHTTPNDYDINNTDIVENFVCNIIQSNKMMESLIEPSLQTRIEKLKLDKTIMAFTLNECKEHCDHLYLLCGKYESNVIALQSALSCSDRAIEAYDVMLALLESKLGSEESRQAVESVARHLLGRLESEKDLPENSLGPWQNTFCISDKPFEPWTSDDDNRLRNHVSKLKGLRSAVQNTAVSLESPFSSYYEKVRIAYENNKEITTENPKLDLELIVDMQEILNLREELNICKQNRDEAERDRQYATEKICILQEALQQLQNQLSDSDVLFNLTSRDRSSFSEAEHAALTEQQLVEALTRESELKSRIQSLIGSVSASRKTSDEKYAQVQSNIKELQKMNLNLSQSVEQNKRKYQWKIKRLEQKIVDLNMELNQYHKKRQPQQIHQRGLSHDHVPETTL